jgi:hypothetical protein
MGQIENYRDEKRAMKYLVAVLVVSVLLPVLASPVAATTQWTPTLDQNNGWSTRCGQWFGGSKTLSCPFSLGDWFLGYASGDSKWLNWDNWYGIVQNERGSESYVGEVGWEAPSGGRLPVAGNSKELYVKEKNGQISLCIGASTWAGDVIGINMQYADGSRAGFLEIYFVKGGLNDYWCYGYNGWQPLDSQRNFMYYMQSGDQFVKSRWVDGDGYTNWVINLSGLINFMDTKSKQDWCFRTPTDLQLNTAYINHVNAYSEAGNLLGKCWNGPSWAKWTVDDITVSY